MPKTTSEPAPVTVARERLADARARARAAQASRTHAEAEHRRLDAEVREHRHRAGRLGEALDDIDERRLAVATAAQRAEAARLVQSGAQQGLTDAEHAVRAALAAHSDDMRRLLDHESAHLTEEYAALQRQAHGFQAHRDALRQRWEELARAEAPDGRTTGWHKDPMTGDLVLTAEAGFRPRRVGVDPVLTSGRPGRAGDARAGFVQD
jgi:chromosome segregation ATPase